VEIFFPSGKEANILPKTYAYRRLFDVVVGRPMVTQTHPATVICISMVLFKTVDLRPFKTSILTCSC